MNPALLAVVTVFFVLVSVTNALAQAPANQKIMVVTEEWPGYTNVNSDGIYDLMIKQVFSQRTFDVQFDYVSFTDSLIMHRRGLADIVLGVYADDMPGALYPETHMDVDVIVVIHREGLPAEELAQLQGKRVAWIKGYRYNQYFPQFTDFIELDSRQVAVKLLQAGKFDFFVDYQTEAINVLSTANIKPGLTTSIIGYLRSYPVFQPDERGKHLANIWDKTMSDLIRQGYFRPHFHKTMNQIYPFDPQVLSKLPDKPAE